MIIKNVHLKRRSKILQLTLYLGIGARVSRDRLQHPLKYIKMVSINLVFILPVILARILKLFHK